MLLASLVALLLSARSGAAAPALAIRLPHRHRRPRLRRTALASTALTSLCTAARLLHALGSQVLGEATVPPAPLLVELLLRAPGTLRAKITHAATPYVGAAEQDPVHPATATDEAVARRRTGQRAACRAACQENAVTAPGSAAVGARQ